MRIKGIIDDKKKIKVREAIAKNDPTLLWPKKKAEHEHAKAKVQLNPDEQEDLNQQLVEAIFNLDHEVVEILLESGADPNSIELHRHGLGFGVKVLSLVAREWDAENSSTYIDKPEKREEKKNRLDAHKKIMELLLINGADPNDTIYDKSILRYFKDKDSQIYELLKKHGAKE